jgi:hypothetical protein
VCNTQQKKVEKAAEGATDDTVDGRESMEETKT